MNSRYTGVVHRRWWLQSILLRKQREFLSSAETVVQKGDEGKKLTEKLRGKNALDLLFAVETIGVD